MTLVLIRRTIKFREITSYYWKSSILRAVHTGTEAACDSLLNRKSWDQSPSSRYNRCNRYNRSSSFCSSPFVSKIGDQSNDYKIDIVDDETWEASTGFADVLKDANQIPSLDQVVNHEYRNSNDPDFDEVDDLRIRGNLFFKLDRDSKEYEEYNYDFHRKKFSKSKAKETRNEDVSKRNDEIRESKTKRVPYHEMRELEKPLNGKRERVPTFNQLTGPYHEPFCLDVYISKASVRACIVHRATSNVVAVAHSISKDMKFDLGSTKNFAACAAVGKVLAQRALADDIYNVVYTPRKGEKVEGKLQSVIDSVMNNGVRVKIKLKKKNLAKRYPVNDTMKHAFRHKPMYAMQHPNRA